MSPRDKTDVAEDLHPISRPLARCPACGSSRLDPVVELERQAVHFLCRDCSRCWHVELGYVHRITPSSCTGCPERDRCEAAYAADHPPADPVAEGAGT